MPNKYKQFKTNLDDWYGFSNMPLVDDEEIVELVPDENDPNFKEPDFKVGDKILVDFWRYKGVATVDRISLEPPLDGNKPIGQVYNEEVFFGVMPPMYRVHFTSEDGSRKMGVTASHISKYEEATV